MADGSQNGSDAAAEAAAERKPTERVILQRIVALRIPDGASEDQVQAAVAALYPKARRADVAGAVGEAWSEVGRRTSNSKTGAIELYAGKPGTPDAKVGTWRAPTVTAWKGAIAYESPPTPLVQRRMFE